MVRTPNLGVHVHCCTVGSDWERRHLLFRDWLRNDQTDRAAYGELKKVLARRDWSDMNAYADAKDSLISEITARAEKWAAASNWSVGVLFIPDMTVSRLDKAGLPPPPPSSPPAAVVEMQ